MASTIRLLEAAEYLYTVDQSNLFLQSLIEAVFAPSVAQFHINMLPQTDKSSLFSTLDKHAIEDIQEMLLFTSIKDKSSHRYLHAAKEYLHYHKHRLLPNEKMARYYENAACIENIDHVDIKKQSAKLALLLETKKQMQNAINIIGETDFKYYESIINEIKIADRSSPFFIIETFNKLQNLLPAKTLDFFNSRRDFHHFNPAVEYNNTIKGKNRNV